MTVAQAVDQNDGGRVEKKTRKQSEFTREQVELIRRLVARGASDDELKLFLYQAQRSGLDPLARQIYFQKRRNRKTGEESFTVLTAIDGYRLIADRTGLYAGNDDPVFDNEAHPRRASVTVYKLIGGIRCPFTATARWDQYYPGDYQGFMWNKMPHLMLGKCAEALALRKAFPAELSGVYVKEEMDQAAKESDLVGDRDDNAAPHGRVDDKLAAPRAPADRGHASGRDGGARDAGANAGGRDGGARDAGANAAARPRDDESGDARVGPTNGTPIRDANGATRVSGSVPVNRPRPAAVLDRQTDGAAVEAPRAARADSAAGAAAAAAMAGNPDVRGSLPAKTVSIYDDGDPIMQKRLANILRSQKVDELLWEAVGRKLHGRPSTELKAVLAAIMQPD